MISFTVKNDKSGYSAVIPASASLLLLSTVFSDPGPALIISASCSCTVIHFDVSNIGSTNIYLPERIEPARMRPEVERPITSGSRPLASEMTCCSRSTGPTGGSALL